MTFTRLVSIQGLGMPYEDTKIKIIHIKEVGENVYKRFPKPYLQFMELHFKQWKRDDLYRKVGELEMQRDFLKKTLIKAGL